MSVHGTKRALAFVDPKRPLTKLLADTFGGPSRSQGKKGRTHDSQPGRRAEIVSEKLCGGLYRTGNAGHG